MTTSAHKQYCELKVKYPDTLLLFRCGDFYETYQEDAENASKVLGITLTTTDGNTRLAAFPYHALDKYLPRLIRAGYRLAICDQLEDKPTAKALNPKKPKRVKLPSLTKQQYELLCECIRYRVADNQAERQDAFSRGHFVKWYDDLNTQLTELKDIIYNLK